MKREVVLLDTTLRDGSYAIDFSYTSNDTAIICSGLEKSGFEYIEIGHGMGLNASNATKYKAIHTDEEYMMAANQSLTHSKYGMFCIPEIARLEDLDLAHHYNMGFIRVGADVDKIELTKEYVKKAKKLGMLVTLNIMKAYALDPLAFSEKVKMVEDYGVDVIYIVDSAGGMFFEDIKKYFEAINRVSNLPIGFHGHDNLGLAISNSIECAKLGVKFIDSSLQGIGRSSGNAVTEILVTNLLKLGFDINIDLMSTLKLGEQFIRPLLNQKGRGALDIICGYAEFHSSYMSYIQRYAAKYSVKPEQLIIEYCKHDKVNLNEEKLEQIARKLPKEKIFLGKYKFGEYVGGEQDSEFIK